MMKEETAFSGKPRDDVPASASGQRSAVTPNTSKKIPILDGWRAVSILLVLAAHLIPVGPKWMELNAAAGAAGMALFFTLSGYLITQFLAAGMPIGDFLVRRLARIIPLGWAAVTILVLWQRPELIAAIRNYAFVENIPPDTFLHGGEHLWSLCVEMQFYVLVAMLCLVLGRKGLYFIPLLALAVTGARIIANQPISIVTWHRIDEILSGGTIALIYAGWFGSRAREIVSKLPTPPFIIVLVVCAHPATGALQYLRPYAAALLVGSSILACPNSLRRVLVSRQMAWVAEISYALYVIHGVLLATWLGSGEKVVKYAKRPLLIATTFLLAHLSTRYFEQPITRRARRWTSGWQKSLQPRSERLA